MRLGTVHQGTSFRQVEDAVNFLPWAWLWQIHLSLMSPVQLASVSHQMAEISLGARPGRIARV